MKKILIGLICVTFLVAGCGKEESKTTSEKTVAKTEDVKVNISTDDGLSVNSDFSSDQKTVFTVKNEGKEIIDNIIFNIAYYDKDNKLIATSNAYTRNVQANKTAKVVVEFPRDYAKYNTIVPNKMEVTVNKEIAETKSAKVYTDKVSATTSAIKGDTSNLKLTVKNTSGVVLDDVEVVTIFYKGDKVVGATTSYLTSVKQVGTTTIALPYYTDGEEGKQLEYDKVETTVNAASQTVA